MIALVNRQTVPKRKLAIWKEKKRQSKHILRVQSFCKWQKWWRSDLWRQKSIVWKRKMYTPCRIKYADTSYFRQSWCQSSGTVMDSLLLSCIIWKVAKQRKCRRISLKVQPVNLFLMLSSFDGIWDLETFTVQTLNRSRRNEKSTSQGMSRARLSESHCLDQEKLA